MSKTREALEAALEVLEQLQGGCTDSDDGTIEVITVWCPEIIEQIQAVLVEPEQEPVAWMRELWSPDCGPYIDYVETRPSYDLDVWKPLYTSPQPPQPREWKELTYPSVFKFGELVEKTSGSQWSGRIVGRYSTSLTPDGYAVESDSHAGSVQIYPAKALRAKNGG